MNAAVRRPSAAFAAFVLHRWDWSETSLIVDLFTREFGRIVVAARGAKRPYSQLRPVLLPFQRIQVQLTRGAQDAEVQNLRSAEWAGGGPMPTGAALFSGFYLNELLMRLLARSDPHERLFDAYARTLPLLAPADDRRMQATLRAFELMLLREIGLLPDLRRETPTQRVLQVQDSARLVPDGGVLVVPSGTGPALPARDLAALADALDRDDLPALAVACESAGPPLRTMLRDLVDYHLGPQALRTREVMLDVQRLVPASRRGPIR